MDLTQTDIMDVVEGLYSKEPTKTLYHYTSQSGLLGIINSNKIWASHLLYLNDSTEFKYATDLMRKTIHSLPDSTLPKIAKDAFTELSQDLENIVAEQFGVYVFSLSEDGDLLSQWRGYCPENFGFSIGFNQDVIKNILTDPNVKLGQCIYDPELHDGIIFQILKKVIEETNRLAKELGEVKDPDKEAEKLEVFQAKIIRTFARPLKIIAPLLKSETFKEEREWRLILFANNSNNFMKHREGNNCLIPYTEIPIFKDGEDKIFDEIIVGPNAHAELTKSSVKSYVKAQRIKVERIRNSNIPYRG